MVFCTLLRSFGNHLYSSGQPLYKWRHLCAFFQKNRLALRPFMPLCWDLVSRWERLQPTTHREPVPLALVKALLSLALSWNWVRFVVVAGLAFFGAARIGEPLRARRSQVLLPSDVLDAELTACYVRVENPKSQHRGTGKVQHFAVRDVAFVRFLEQALQKDKPETPLFPASPATFRRRWDTLLKSLGVPRNLRLTPGGLRAGGCVHLYNQGTSIPNLMWQMRIRQQTTLESYLQEIAALNVLPALTPEARRSIEAASSLYPYQLQAFRA